MFCIVYENKDKINEIIIDMKKYLSFYKLISINEFDRNQSSIESQNLKSLNKCQSLRPNK